MHTAFSISLQSLVDSMVHDTLITVGLVPGQMSALFLGMRMQQLTQNRPHLLRWQNHQAAFGRGQSGGGAGVLDISNLPQVLCTSIRARKLLKHSAWL